MVNFFAKSVLVAVLVGTVHATCDLASVMDQTVITGSDSDTRSYHNGFCQITFPSNGAFKAGTTASETQDKHIDFEPNPKSVCTSSTRPVKYRLQTDGNFVFRCTNRATDYSTSATDYSTSATDYSTHSDGVTDNYFLAIDRNCELNIFKGTFACDSKTRTKVWSSEKVGEWRVNERLRMGQVYKGLTSYLIVLRPSTGNLEAFYTGGGSFKRVWSANPTAVPTKYDDYYAQLTTQGRLILRGIDYPTEVEGEYYSKTLQRTGTSSCYKLSVKKLGATADANIELIAINC